MLRHALRSLAATPVLALAAVFCLALGIGSTTSIFTAVNTALLRPLPFEAPERLVSVFRTTPHFRSGPFSAPNFADLRRETRSLETLVAVATGSGLVQTGDASIRVSTAQVSDDFFAMLGARPVLGRLFRPGQDESAETPVLLLSEEAWRDHFGGDPGVVGRTVRLNGQIHEVVGVVRRGFRLPHGGSTVSGDVWVPLRVSPAQSTARRSNYLRLVGRLADGRTVDQADAEMRRIMDGVIEQNPELRGEQLRVVSLHRESKQSIQGPLTLLLGAVGLVLLIAAANVASLLLARGVARQAEWAVRRAIGASRKRLLGDALVESALVTAAGGALGLGLAWAATRVIGAMVPAGLPQLQDVGLDGRVLGFSVALAVAVTFLCGVGPAWQAQRADPHDALRAGARAGASRGHHRFLRTLIVAEVALSLMLLLAAGLVLRGFAQLMDQEPGFDPETLLTIQIDMPADRYADGSALDLFLEPALENVRALAGVRGAAAISLVPYTNWGWNFNIRYEGVPGDDPTTLPLTETRTVTPGFFETMGMTLLRGRLPTAADDEREEAPVVAVANRALVERDFPDGDAVGRRFHTGDTTFATIIGVVSDIRNAGPYAPPQPEVYWTYAQAGRGWTSFPIVVRTDGDPARLAEPVVRALLSADPAAAVSRVRPMTDVISASMGRPRFYLVLMGAFAAVAVLLAVAGLYGVMSYAVEQRRREIGIRSALGGTPRSNLRLVVRSGGTLILAGLAAGLVGAAFATRLLEGLLFGLSRLDPAAWAAAPALLAVAGLGAVLVAARRAARVDPMVAIRE